MLLADIELDAYSSIIEMKNGAKVLCKRIPPMLLRAFDRSHQEPKPPMHEVEVLGGKTVLEENPLDPAYKDAVKAFENKQAEDFLNLAMDFLALVDETEEQAQERSAQLEHWGIQDGRVERIEAFALEYPEDDVQVLTQELMRLSTVTTGEVKQAKEFFRPPVDGNGSDQVGDAEVASDLRDGA